MDETATSSAGRTAGGTGESTMAGHGFYGAHSRPQHAAASVAYPLLEAAAGQVPLPAEDRALGVLDMGCVGGANEMEPMAIALDALGQRGWAGDVQVVHTDLPHNDFGPLFDRLGGPDGYPAGRRRVYPTVVGRTLYGPLVPDRSVQLGWSGITLHWLSTMPDVHTEAVYPNLTSGAAREALAHRAAEDWSVFLAERARELVDGGELVLVAGASLDDGTSGAEALFRAITVVLDAMVAAGELRADERARIHYPTWNRTTAEWLAPFEAADPAPFEVLAHHLDASDDADTFPQFRHGHDAEAFAAAYVPFVRAITEAPFFRWLDADRGADERRHVVERFYERLRASFEADADVAAVWHVVSLRLRRRPRS